MPVWSFGEWLSQKIYPFACNGFFWFYLFLYNLASTAEQSIGFLRVQQPVAYCAHTCFLLKVNFSCTLSFRESLYLGVVWWPYHSYGWGRDFRSVKGTETKQLVLPQLPFKHFKLGSQGSPCRKRPGFLGRSGYLNFKGGFQCEFAGQLAVTV